MQDYEFHRWYANVPMKDRFIPLSFQNTGLTTLADIYRRMNQLEDQIRPAKIEMDHLLQAVDQYIRDTKSNPL